MKAMCKSDFQVTGVMDFKIKTVVVGQILFLKNAIG